MRKPRATKPLAKKLCAIRLWKDMTQGEILRLVYPEADENHRALISQWENASREPRREVLTRYAQLASISLEELLLDEKELPALITRNTDRYDGDIRKKREIEIGITSTEAVQEQLVVNLQTTQETIDNQKNEMAASGVLSRTDRRERAMRPNNII